MGVSTYWDVYSRVSKVFDPKYSVLRPQTYFSKHPEPPETNPVESTVFHPLSRHIVIPASLGGMLFKKTKKKKIVEKTIEKIANFPWSQGYCIQFGQAKKWIPKYGVLEVQYLWHSLKYQPRRRQSWDEPKREKDPWIDGSPLLQNRQALVWQIQAMAVLNDI